MNCTFETSKCGEEARRVTGSRNQATASAGKIVVTVFGGADEMLLIDFAT
jgi:hypothetical protein